MYKFNYYFSCWLWTGECLLGILVSSVATRKMKASNKPPKDKKLCSFTLCKITHCVKSVQMSRVISGPYLPLFRPEITPYLDNFYAVTVVTIFLKVWNTNPVNIYLFKVNYRNGRKKCKIRSKLAIKTPE